MELSSSSIIIDDYVVTKFNKNDGSEEIRICKISYFENKLGRSTSSLIKITSGNKIYDNLIISELYDNKIKYDDVIDAWTRGKLLDLISNYKDMFRVAIEAPQLPSLPYYIEPTHYHSSECLYNILDSVKYALSSSNIEILSFDNERCKFKCQYINNNNILIFILRIFKDRDYHLIEFQRRNGDRMYFSYIYDVISQALNKKNIIDDSIPPSSQSFNQFKPRMNRTHIENIELLPFH